MGTISYPDKWLQQMEQQLGDEYPAFREALDQRPVVSLRYNPRRKCPPFEGGTPVPWCPNAFYLKERPRFVRDPHVHVGGYYVQEASSMMLANLIDWKKDQRILDLCAAPGGKSTLISSLMSEHSVLVSNELVGDRAQVLEDNIIRWGDPRVIVTCAHPKDFSALRHTFDVIVVDAPCSGEGMFRKDPDTIAHWSPGNVRHCSQRQTDILRFVSGALKPGGRLIYSTCTYNEQENESIVDWLLALDRGMYKVLPLDLPEAWGLSPGISNGHDDQVVHARHCYPHKVNGEGLFFVVLEKTREGSDHFHHGKREQDLKRKRDKERHRNLDREEERRTPRPSTLSPKEVQSVAGQFFQLPEGVSAVPDEEQVWLQLPQVRQTLEAIRPHVRVKRAGVLAGKIAGNKFIPDHDLAMSGWTSDAFPRIELDRENALRYLKRMDPEVTLSQEASWVVLHYEGNPLGWAKAVNGRINNHLPKHWRIRADVLDEFEDR